MSFYNNRKFLIISHIILIILPLLIYSNSFDGVFQFDDQRVILENPTIRNINDLNIIWETDKGRFLTNLTFAFNYYLGKYNVFGYHLLNLLFHILSVISVFWLVILIFETPLIRDKIKPQGYLTIIALFTALFFGCHPVQTQAVTYIVQRYEVMASLFYILTIVFYIKSRLLNDEKKKAKFFLFFFLSMLSMVLSLLCKEIGLSIPFMIVLCELLFFTPSFKGIMKKWEFLLPFFVLELLPFFLITRADINELKYDEMLSPYLYFLNSGRAFMTYLRLLFLPFGQSLDYDFIPSAGFFHLPIIFSLLAIIFIIFAAIRLVGKNTLYSFAIFWFFGVLSVTTSFMPIRDVINEHRMYLSVFSGGLVVSLLSFTFLKDRFKKFPWFIAPIIIILIFSILTYSRNFVWKTESSLWLDALRKAPNKPRVLNNAGYSLYKMGKLEEAKEYFKKSILLRADYVGALNNYGISLRDLGEYDLAIKYFKKAAEIEPFNSEYYNNIGLAYMKKKDFSTAMEYFDRAIQIKEEDYFAHNNKGRILEQEGRLDKAALEYQKAYKYNPNSYEICNNLGNVYLCQKQYDTAKYYFERAISIQSTSPEVYNNLGILYKLQDNPYKAVEYFEKALEIQPKLFEAHCNLGFLYLMKIGDKEKALYHFKEYLKYKPYEEKAADVERIVNALEQQR